MLLAGPTASGKTSLSIRLAKKLCAEIVNADSMQVYRHMDIGTAKPSASEQKEVPHHLLDAADPDEPFDAAKYLDLARPAVEDIQSRGKVPLVVGGTGLYMKVLTRGICSGPPSDPAIKEDLLREEEKVGLDGLFRELARIDPQSASRIHPHDRQRVLRALEVFRICGVPLSEFQMGHRFEHTVFPAAKIFIFRDREDLYARIDQRVEQMIGQGLEDEVRRLLSMGYGPELKPMQSLGYRQMVLHIQGRLSMDEAVTLIKRDTRRYAKRQHTWFRGDPGFSWFHAEDWDGIEDYLAGAGCPASEDRDYPDQ